MDEDGFITATLEQVLESEFWQYLFFSLTD
jgi:hypothetical protein